jgi:hypothetical protein
MRMARRGPVAFALAWTPFLVAVALPLVWLWGGQNASLGLLIGVSLSWVSLWTARLVVTNSFDRANTSLSTQSRLQLLLLAKLPVIAVVTFFTNSLGLGAVKAFLGGYLLVYLALVFGALSKSGPPANTDELR